MSGSPKRCTASLTPEQEQRLREERRRQAELEAKRRREEEERQRRERMEQARTNGGDHASRVLGSVERFRATEAGSFVAAELEQCAESVRAARQELSEASSEAEIQRITRKLERIESDVRAAFEKGDALRLTQQLGRHEQDMEVVKRQFEGLPKSDSMRHDRAGYQSVQQHLARATDAAQRRDIASATHHLDLAKQELHSHRERVLACQAEENAKRDQAAGRLGQTADQLAGMSADPVVSRWMQAELAQLRERLAAASAAQGAGQFTAAVEEAGQIEAELAAVVDRAQELQLQEERRDFILAGIKDVMAQLNFSCESEYLEYEDDPQSARVLRARRPPDNRPLAISVPLEGEIWYTIDKKSIHSVPNTQGKPVTRCDEAQRQIEVVHADLKRQFGIAMSPLVWDDADPELIDSVAMRLPDDAAHTQDEQQARGAND